MFKIGVISLFLSFVLIVAAFLIVYYQVIPIDPMRAIIGGFATCMILGTSPVWLAWLRGTDV